MLSLTSGLLAIFVFLSFLIKGSARRSSEFYPRVYFHIAKVCDRIAYIVGPAACLLILTIGWNFAPLPLYLAWLGAFVCTFNLTVAAIKAGRDYDDLSFGNLALDILIAMPLFLLFFFGTVAFLIAISTQS